MDKKSGGDGKKNDNKINFFSLIIAGLVLTVFINSLIGVFSSGKKTTVQYSKFIELVEIGAVKNVQISSDRVSFTLRQDADKNKVIAIFSSDLDYFAEMQTDYIFDESRTFHSGIVMYDAELLPLLKEKNVTFYTAIQNSNPIMDFVLSWVLPIAFFYGISMFIMSRMSNKMMGSGEGGFMNFGKTNAKLYNIEQKTGVTFADFAGSEEAKESLTELVDFLHFPEKYIEIGAKQPKGALLVGPPGTGKTLLAKAVAGEANVPFFSLSGSEFVEMYVGVGASRVRDLFKQANKNAPCIIFIDEIDAIGKSRDNQIGGNDEREQTLNQLLSEMDGFDSSKGIVILGATNRPEILDKALLRPGRFDRRVIVEKPDLIGREAILAVHAKKVKLDRNVKLKQIALATSGASGADLANMINEGALRAVKMGRKEVMQEDIMESVEVVIAGKEKKDRIMSEKEKRLVAFHEVGHALVSSLQKDSQPVQKITIVPRTMGALGYVMHMPEEEKYLMTKDELMAEITTMLAGRAAEEVEFETETTGASDDIERATKLARSMVARYGMSREFGMMGLESVENRYLDGRSVANYSESTGAEIDKAVLSIIDDCHKKAVELLSNSRRAMTEIAEYLIKQETITGEKFMEILNMIRNEGESEPEAVEKTVEEAAEVTTEVVVDAEGMDISEDIKGED